MDGGLTYSVCHLIRSQCRGKGLQYLVMDLKRSPRFRLDTSWTLVSSGIFINSTPSNLQRPWRVRGILGVWPLLLLLLIPLIKSDMSSEGEETSADNQEVISSLLTRSALEFQFTQLVFLLEGYFLCFLPACLSCELRLSTNCSTCVLLLGPNPIHNICKV